MRILLVEDEDAIATPVVEGLIREGYEVRRVATGAEAIDVGDDELVLLDLRLPDMDGLDVCRQIRLVSDVPVIMTTARGEEIDRVIGLEIGADDYLVKPYGLRELIARIRAVTRRTSGTSGRSATPTRLEVGPLRIDLKARRVAIDDAEIALTAKEFDLLSALATSPGEVVSRQALLRDVWETNWYGSTKTIDVHVAALRRKLTGVTIETVRGIGFRLETG